MQQQQQAFSCGCVQRFGLYVLRGDFKLGFKT